MRPALLMSLSALALTQSGCAMHHLARTVGEGNGELSVSAGGPFFSNLGAPIPLPNVAVNGRAGVTDGFDLGGGLSFTGLAYGMVALRVDAVGQILREPRGLALSLSAHGHFLVGVRGPDLRVYPEVGLHIEGVARPWLIVYGGAFAFAQLDPPDGKPTLFPAPYAGLEALWGGDDANGHPFGLAIEAGWVSPWTNSVSVVSWEPAGLGSIYVQLGFRVRFGGLDR